MNLLLIIFLAYLGFSQPISVYEIKQEEPWMQNFRQRKMNSTFLFRMNSKTSNLNYILIELTETSEKKRANLILLQSYQQPPYQDPQAKEKKIVSDNVDIHGKLQSKKYHHIVLQNYNTSISEFYLTIVTNETIHYNLSIANINIFPCPKNCSNKGTCHNGKCQCFSGFIDEDCSQKAFAILPFEEFSKNVNKKHSIYLYSNIITSRNYLLKVKIVPLEDECIKIKVQIKISKFSYLPCDAHNDFSTLLDLEEELVLNEQVIPINNQVQQQNQEIDDQNHILVIKLNSQEKLRFNLTMTLEEQFPEREKLSMTNLAIIIVFLVVIIVGIRYGYTKCRYCKLGNILADYKITEFKFGSDPTQENQCSICLDFFSSQSSDIIVRTICKHIFHKACLLKWLEYQQFCPVCRTQFNQ